MKMHVLLASCHVFTVSAKEVMAASCPGVKGVLLPTALRLILTEPLDGSSHAAGTL